MAVSSSHGLHYCGSVRIVGTLASLIRAKSYWTLDSSSQISAQMTKHSLDNRSVLLFPCTVTLIMAHGLHYTLGIGFYTLMRTSAR
ncbi:hypothetical protein L208DRAFT_569045 [Tricholoma matsutake]|nr:hypothetical protein L208DRAFT_569045 [Tricholoma matsutake 945]